MNNEEIYDGITEIHDDLIDGAGARGGRRRRRWAPAVAAVVAAVALVGAVLRPGSGGGRPCPFPLRGGGRHAPLYG